MRMKLTARNIGRAVRDYRGGEVIYFDTELPGFRLRFRGRRRVFEVHYGPRGRRRLYTLGDFGPLTPDAARTEAKKILGDVARGLDPAEQRRASRAMPTFATWVDEYLEAVKQRKKRPREDQRFLGSAKRRWGNRPLDKITAHDVEKAFQVLVASGHRTSANRWLASVRACLQDAWRHDKISTNPAMKVQPLPESEPRTRILNDDELARLVTAVEGLENPHLRAAFALLLATGARLSEVLHARWADIDLDAGTWRIPSPKAGRPQVVPLADSVAAMVRNLPRVGTLVIPGHNNPERPRFDLKKPWEQLLKAARLDRESLKAAEREAVHIHDIRRTIGFRVTRSQGLHVASRFLRHADVRVTERHYAPLGLEELRKVAETQAKALAPVLAMPQRRREGEPR